MTNTPINEGTVVAWGPEQKTGMAITSVCPEGPLKGTVLVAAHVDPAGPRPLYLIDVKSLTLVPADGEGEEHA